MDIRRKVFLRKNPYDMAGRDEIFLCAVKEDVRFHAANCKDYARILALRGFDIDSLRDVGDIHKIPPIPTLYFKRNTIASLPDKKLIVQAYSSGTKGAQSRIGLDFRTLALGIVMMVRFFAYHKILSFIPVNYIMLGYKPEKGSNRGALKTAYGTTKFAPALHRAYALMSEGEGYAPNTRGVLRTLQRSQRTGTPVRFVGFPAYMYFLAQELERNGLSFKLNKRSKILMGGGWKQFSDQEIDRDDFYALIERTLGIGREHCFEFFSAVEHPLPYLKCKNGHFHTHIYSRVIIRDTATLEPVPDGATGLLSFVTPFVGSMPLTSVVTDDIAAVHAETPCGCGIDTPYFDLIGRAGVSQIKTCTTDAAELLGRGV